MKLDKVYGATGRSVVSHWLGRALDTVFPVPCLACDRPASDAGRAIGLCIRCHGLLSRWPASACAMCGLPVAAAKADRDARCGECRRTPPPYRALLAVWRYRPPLDAVMAALKFRRLDYLGPRLGRAAAETLAPRLPPSPVVVPVPLHLLRRIRRGFDQAELIARGLASRGGWPLVPALRRCRWTRAQTRLERTVRLRNPRRAFALAGRRRVRQLAGRDVVLVDDVVTTGATAAAAARVLNRASVRSVTVVAVARTPLPCDP